MMQVLKSYSTKTYRCLTRLVYMGSGVGLATKNQHIILQFIRKFLSPNGIVYISYNCLTGWAANMPVRELFHSHFKFNSTSTNPLQKVNDSLNFSEELLTQNPLAQRNPNALNKVQDLKAKSKLFDSRIPKSRLAMFLFSTSGTNFRRN